MGLFQIDFNTTPIDNSKQKKIREKTKIPQANIQNNQQPENLDFGNKQICKI